jgi:uncharacterized membrane protein YhaH (DUF805 family)
MSNNNIYNYKTPKSGNEETGFFNIKGRISRKPFFSRWALAIGIYFLSDFLYVSGLYGQHDSRSYIFFETINVYILPLLLAIFILIQGAKRMHDVNKTGWYFLIPIYNLYLIFCKGSIGTNEFGIDPKPATKVTYFDEIPNNQIVKKINEDASPLYERLLGYKSYKKANQNNKKNSLIAFWVVVIGVAMLIFSFSLFIYYKLDSADSTYLNDSIGADSLAIAVDSLAITVDTPGTAFTTSEAPKEIVDSASADGIHLSDDDLRGIIGKLEQGADGKNSAYDGQYKFQTTFDNPVMEVPLREQPDVNSREVYKCPKNAIVYVIDNSGNTFIKVNVNGYTGYLSAGWLKRQE